MVDVAATVLGVLLALVVLALIGGGTFYAYLLKIAGVTPDPAQSEKVKAAFDSLLSPLVCTILILVCALIPIIFFSTGFFTDTINQSWNYSQASIIGIISVIVLKVFGSTWIADLSKKIVGWLPNLPSFRVPDPSDATKTIWSLSFGAIWRTIVWVILVGGIIVAGPITSSLVGGAQWGEGITLGVTVPFIAMLLAGNGYLGTFSEMTKSMTGGGTFQINPYPEGLCDVPGFGWAANPIAPASIVLTQSIAWYHLVKNWDLGYGSQSAALGSVSGAVFLLQWWALNLKGCLGSYRAGFYSPIIAYLLAVGIGGAGYEVIKNLPSLPGSSTGSASGTTPAPVNPTGLVCPAGQTPNTQGYCVPGSCPTGQVMSSDGSGKCVAMLGPSGEQKVPVGGTRNTSSGLVGSGQSAPVDPDQDAFVCEAYKDGELVTSTIVE